VSDDIYNAMDPGIVFYVRALRDAGVETFEACQGGLRDDGSDHAYPEPTVRFAGDAGAGMRALGVCTALGFPTMALRRVWTVSEGQIEMACWELVFRKS
jgi:hypothetical protein